MNGWLGVVLAMLVVDTGSLGVVDVGGAPSSGVFWPRAFGFRTSPDPSHRQRRLALQDLTGRELPARFEVMSRWPDGSPRWWRVTPGEWSGTRRAQVRSVRHPPRRRPAEVCVTSGGWSYRPRPGADATGRDDDGLWFGRPGDRMLLPWARMGVETDGRRSSSASLESELRTGPDAAGLSLDLRWRLGDHCPVHVRGRVAVSTGGRFLALDLCLTATAPTALRRWTLPLVVDAAPVRVEGLGERWVAEQDRSVTLAASRQGIGDAVPADPSARVQAGLGSRSLRLHWPGFARRRPAAVTLRDQEIRLHLVDGDVFLDRGQSIRRRFVIGRGDAASVAGSRPPTRLRVTSGPTLDPSTREWIDRWVDYLDHWVSARTWMEDHGCYATRHGAFANGEYDLGASLLALGQRLGDDRMLALGEVLVRHTMDWDVAVDVPEPWPEGLYSHHGDRHASDRVEAGHVWVDGFVQLARVRGDMDGYGTARRVGSALAGARQHGALFEGPERRLGWPLRVALDLNGVSDDRAWPALARSLIEAFAVRQTEAGYLDGDRRPVGPEKRVWINVWVGLGISVDTLLEAESRLGLEQAGNVAAQYGRFLVDEALRDGMLAEVLLVDPATGAVEERRGRCRKGGAALASAGLASLARRVGDPALARAAEDHWQLARADLDRPHERDLVEWAKALRGLRRRLELAAAESADR